MEGKNILLVKKGISDGKHIWARRLNFVLMDSLEPLVGFTLVQVSSDFLPVFIDRLVAGESQSSFYSEKWIFLRRKFILCTRNGVIIV